MKKLFSLLVMGTLISTAAYTTALAMEGATGQMQHKEMQKADVQPCDMQPCCSGGCGNKNKDDMNKEDMNKDGNMKKM